MRDKTMQGSFDPAVHGSVLPNLNICYIMTEQKLVKTIIMPLERAVRDERGSMRRGFDWMPLTSIAEKTMSNEIVNLGFDASNYIKKRVSKARRLYFAFLKPLENVSMDAFISRKKPHRT